MKPVSTPEELIENWRRRYVDDGASLRDIARSDGVATNTVRDRLLKVGVSFDPGPRISAKRRGHAKLYGSPERFTHHAAGDTNYVNHIDGRIVTTIFEKKQVALEISPDTLAKLQEVRDLYWAAYMAADGNL